jgi:hypothetical protein
MSIGQMAWLAFRAGVGKGRLAEAVAVRLEAVSDMFAGVAVPGLVAAIRMIETRNLRLEEIAR